MSSPIARAVELVKRDGCAMLGGDLFDALRQALRPALVAQRAAYSCAFLG
jgi:hypothetical protein